MKIWKVRKDVDLNMLAEFGYEFGKHGIIAQSWFKELDYNDRIIIYPDGIIAFDFEDVLNAENYERKALSDLIVAGLVYEIEI